MVLKKLDNRKLYVIACLIIFAIAIFLRTWNLGKFGFWTDEMYHVIGARSILEEGRPVFPSGDEYTRAIGFTYVVAVFFNLFGISELTARLPGVISNILFLSISFWVVLKWFDRRIALFYLLCMTASPYTLILARQCRMYAPFQLFFFLGTVFFFIGLENRSLGDEKRLKKSTWTRKLDINVPFLLFSAICFGVSNHLQPITKIFIGTVAVYVTCMFIYEISCRNNDRSLIYKYLIVIVLFILTTIGIMLFSPATLSELWSTARWHPIWAAGRYFGAHFYRYFLTDNYPFLFFAFPLAVILFLKKYQKLGLYFVLSFCVPVVIHSLLFTAKQARYIFNVFPFFVIISSFLVIKTIDIWIHYSKREKKIFTKQELIIYVLGSVFFLFIIVHPWLMNSKNIIMSSPWPDWKEFSKKTAHIFSEKDKLLVTNQNHLSYYLKHKPDYYIRNKYDCTPLNAEYFSGISPIKNHHDLKEVFRKNKCVYLITQRGHFNSDNFFDEKMREFIQENCKGIDVPYSKWIKIYEKNQRE